MTNAIERWTFKSAKAGHKTGTRMTGKVGKPYKK